MRPSPWKQAEDCREAAKLPIAAKAAFNFRVVPIFIFQCRFPIGTTTKTRSQLCINSYFIVKSLCCFSNDEYSDMLMSYLFDFFSVATLGTQPIIQHPNESAPAQFTQIHFAGP